MNRQSVALVDVARERALVDDQLYIVWRAAADAVHVHRASDGLWLGRVTARVVRPAIHGVLVAGHARRRRAMRVLGAIQRAWFVEGTVA